MSDKKETYYHISEKIDNTFLAGLSHDKLNERLKEAYLGVIVNRDTIANPLIDIPMFAQENFNEYLVYLMSRPEYFYFIIKTMFGMESYPLQCITLRELYTHRFPMLIAARGFSKCIAPQSLIITKDGIKRIKELIPEDLEGVPQQCDGSLLGENKYTKIKYGFYNGIKPTKIIKTRSGREIECTLDHPLRAIKSGEIVWKNTEDIKVGEFLPISRGAEQWENYISLDKDIAYMIGAFVGDGCYTQKSSQLKFTNIDNECIKEVRKGVRKWNKDSDLVNQVSGKAMDFIVTGRLIKNKFIKDFNCNQYSKDTGKLTPKIILQSDFDTIINYLQGLFDTDGCSPTNTPIVEFSTKTKELAQETQMLLMCLGINSALKEQYNKKYSKNYYKLIISGSSLRVFRDKVGFRISRKQTILDAHCSKIVNENVDLIPHELILDKILKLRELSKDTIYYNKENRHDKDLKSISPNKLKSYRQSYASINKFLNKMSESPAASSSQEFADVKSIVDKNYYYDEVISISDSTCKTYDVELVEDHSFISNGFISHNTFILGLYTLIRMITTPGIKCVLTGAGFRQAKLIFEVMETVWHKAPMLKNCFKSDKNGPKHGTDSWSFRLGDSICWALPIGHDGSKIRGYRSNLLICDEKATVQKMIFEEVISGFLSVSSNPVEQVKRRAIIDAKKALGVKITEEDYDETGNIQNQLVQAGTAYYKHNHFYEDYIKWKRIIHSEGDFSKLAGLEGLNPDYFNWRDYSVMRVPVGLIPTGFMDMSQISRIKASTSKDVYLREFETIFCDDSDGFFKRSLIDFCTPSESNIVIKDGESVKFSPVLYGDKNKKYVYGIDPAYQGDNFAVVILEIHPSHRRVVHCWTTQASDHKQMLKDFREGKCTINVENQYYDYCARKIRTLMKRFPCAFIALDAQGGGRAIMEAFMDPSKLEPGEELILPAIDPDEKPQETDHMQGDHIIKVFKNTSENITDANHSLKKDMESRDIIFPHHDSISQILTEFYDTSLGDSAVLYDTLDDCVSNIEELKNELSTITISETKTGKESFDTPETKGANAKKGRLRKDRYSALLMANWVARSEANLITRPLNSSDVMTMGGYVDKNNPDAMYIGNSKLAQRLNDLYL